MLRHTGGSVRGFLALLDLTSASDQDRMADPGAAAAWDHVQREGGVRHGQRVRQTRFVIDAENYQGPSPTLNAAPVVTLQLLSVRHPTSPGTSSPSPSRTAGTTTSPWATWAGSTVPTSPSAAGASGCSGTTSEPCRSVRGWTCGASVPWRRTRALPPRRSVVQLVLSQPDFANAVRQGLKDLARPDLLARNPLLRTRLLADAAAGDRRDAAGLDRVLRVAVATLAQDPATTSSTGRSSRPTFDGRPPRRGLRPDSGCPSAPTDDTSARASPGSWPGAGNARSTVPTEAHHRI